jgi:hypothetical protein
VARKLRDDGEQCDQERLALPEHTFRRTSSLTGAISINSRATAGDSRSRVSIRLAQSAGPGS